ncbi:MAG: tyrosyl-tRNA synthetase [Lysobacterales bacterium]
MNDSPTEMFGKIMSISDELMLKYYEYLTDEDLTQLPVHPKEAKAQLGEVIVTQFHNADKGKKARADFDNTFSKGQVEVDMPSVALESVAGKPLIDVLLEQGLVSTKNDARRMIKQNAVSLDGVKISDEKGVLGVGILKVGKKRFLKII